MFPLFLRLNNTSYDFNIYQYEIAQMAEFAITFKISPYMKIERERWISENERGNILIVFFL